MRGHEERGHEKEPYCACKFCSLKLSVLRKVLVDRYKDIILMR